MSFARSRLFEESCPSVPNQWISCESRCCVNYIQFNSMVYWVQKISHVITNSCTRRSIQHVSKNQCIYNCLNPQSNYLIVFLAKATARSNYDNPISLLSIYENSVSIWNPQSYVLISNYISSRTTNVQIIIKIIDYVLKNHSRKLT